MKTVLSSATAVVVFTLASLASAQSVPSARTASVSAGTAHGVAAHSMGRRNKKKKPSPVVHG